MLLPLGKSYYIIINIILFIIYIYYILFIIRLHAHEVSKFAIFNKMCYNVFVFKNIERRTPCS